MSLLVQGILFNAVTLKPNKTVAPADRSRTDSHRLQLLARLRQGPATSDDLIDIAHRFGARINELRNAGCVIERERIYDSSGKATALHRYTLLSCPGELRGGV